MTTLELLKEHGYGCPCETCFLANSVCVGADPYDPECMCEGCAPLQLAADAEVRARRASKGEPVKKSVRVIDPVLMLRTKSLSSERIGKILCDVRESAIKVRVRTKAGCSFKGWVMDVMEYGDTITVGDYLHKSVTVDLCRVKWIEVRGYLETRVYSKDGKPLFHNGRWQESGDLTYQDGRCERCGKEWGASRKVIRCICGASVYLT